MNAGPAPRRRPGFSLVELLVTLVALGLAAWIVLRVVDRGSRLGLPVAPSGPEAVLDAALRSLKRDVLAAASGGPGARDAFRPVGDNAPASPLATYRTPEGEVVAVRPGTDQLGLRGVLRSPLLRLEAREEGPLETFADAVRAHPASVALRAPASRDLASARARLAEASGPGKAFFLVRDASSRWAVARVAAPPADGPSGSLDLVLDFADADARAYAPEGALSLGPPVRGGAFDDLVWFVARGPEGRPPDYVRGSDPASLAFPHPYLAVASAAGGGTWRIRRAGEDVENLQIAWGLAGESGGIAWRSEAPGGVPPRPEELADAQGRRLLAALRVALVARAPLRIPRSSGAPPPEFPLPLNAPSPEKMPEAAPIGWDPILQLQIRYDRETRDEVVTLPARSGEAR